MKKLDNYYYFIEIYLKTTSERGLMVFDNEGYFYWNGDFNPYYYLTGNIIEKICEKAYDKCDFTINHYSHSIQKNNSVLKYGFFEAILVDFIDGYYTIIHVHKEPPYSEIILRDLKKEEFIKGEFD